MASTIIELLAQLVKYFATKEVNYNVRTLRELYNEEEKIIKNIVDIEGDPSANPEPSHILQLTDRLEKTRKLITVLSAKTFPS